MLPVSERRTCQVLGQHRSTQRHAPKDDTDERRLTADIVALAKDYGRYGYRRIHALLGHAGLQVSLSVVERIWRRERSGSGDDPGDHRPAILRRMQLPSAKQRPPGIIGNERRRPGAGGADHRARENRPRRSAPAASRPHATPSRRGPAAAPARHSAPYSASDSRSLRRGSDSPPSARAGIGQPGIELYAAGENSRSESQPCCQAPPGRAPASRMMKSSAARRR